LEVPIVYRFEPGVLSISIPFILAI
jgi:hypothetical protein